LIGESLGGVYGLLSVAEMLFLLIAGRSEHSHEIQIHQHSGEEVIEIVAIPPAKMPVDSSLLMISCS